jgi:hypothetical protein
MCFTKQEVQPILKQSVKALLEQQDGQGRWSFPAHLGTHYISLYALFLEWLRCRGVSSRLDLNRLARVLLETQVPDGSWRQARDPALPSTAWSWTATARPTHWPEKACPTHSVGGIPF